MNDAIGEITTQDLWIPGQDGRLFARLWTPERPRSEVPLILFHDSLGSVELWRNFPAALAACCGRQVIAYDRLGFGRADARRGRQSLDFIAAEADGGFADLRQQLGIGRFALFGHSVGGGIAVNCAARHADDCVALITESAQAFVEQRTVRGVEEARALFADPEQVRRLARYHGDKAAWVLAAWIDTWLSPDFAGWSLRPVLPRVRCPLLAIHGVDDEYGSPKHPELIGQLAGGPTRVELIADTRHVPHREREDAVLAMVGGFLHGVA